MNTSRARINRCIVRGEPYAWDQIRTDHAATLTQRKVTGAPALEELLAALRAYDADVELLDKFTGPPHSPVWQVCAKCQTTDLALDVEFESFNKNSAATQLRITLWFVQRRLMETMVEELPDPEPEDLRRHHLEMLLDSHINDSDVRHTIASSLVEQYSTIAPVLIAQICGTDAVLAAAHNALMHSINGNTAVAHNAVSFQRRAYLGVRGWLETIATPFYEVLRREGHDIPYLRFCRMAHYANNATNAYKARMRRASTVVRVSFRATLMYALNLDAAERYPNVDQDLHRSLGLATKRAYSHAVAYELEKASNGRVRACDVLGEPVPVMTHKRAGNVLRKLRNRTVHATNGNIAFFGFVLLSIAALLSPAHAAIGAFSAYTPLINWNIAAPPSGTVPLLIGVDLPEYTSYPGFASSNTLFGNVTASLTAVRGSRVRVTFGNIIGSKDGASWSIFKGDSCYGNNGMQIVGRGTYPVTMTGGAGMVFMSAKDGEAWAPDPILSSVNNPLQNGNVLMGCQKYPGYGAYCFDDNGEYFASQSRLVSTFDFDTTFLCLRWQTEGAGNMDGVSPMTVRILTGYSRADEEMARKHNKLMHALNGNQYQHNNVMINPRSVLDGRKSRKGVGRDSRFHAYAKRMRLTGASKNFIIQNIDPFHDSRFRAVVMPEDSSNVVFKTLNPSTVTITMPEDYADGTRWDMHLVASPIFSPDPYLPLHNGMSLDSVPNGEYVTGSVMAYVSSTDTYNSLLRYTAGAINDCAWVPVGLCGLIVPSGEETFQALQNGNSSNPNMRPFQVPVPVDMMRGAHALTGLGFEVHNVSPMIEKPGAVAVYRTPFPCKEVAKTITDTAAGLTARNAYMFPEIPSSFPIVRRMQDSKIWEAKDGTYSVARPIGYPRETRPSLATPICNLEAIDLADIGSNLETRTIGLMAVTVGGTVGAKTLVARPLVIMPQQWDLSGVYFQGLDDQSVLTIDANAFVQHVPNVALAPDSIFARSGDIPQYPSPNLERVLKKLYSVLPPGVPVDMNDWGEWWERVCDIIGAMSPIADAVVPGAGHVVASGARVARVVPSVVRTVTTTVKNRKKPVKSMATKKKQVKKAKKPSK